jgi:hypothetical protein
LIAAPGASLAFGPLSGFQFKIYVVTYTQEPLIQSFFRSKHGRNGVVVKALARVLHMKFGHFERLTAFVKNGYGFGFHKIAIVERAYNNPHIFHFKNVTYFTHGITFR